MNSASRTSGSRKEEIFEAALFCFNEKGYHRTSIDDIALKGKISKGGIYYYFRSKEELFLELFKFRLNWYIDQLKAYIQKERDSIAFRAESKGKNCIEGVYRWRIESGIGSQIGNDGMYTAGMNTTGGEATDTLTAEDTVNRIESLRYVTVRYEKITAVTPAALSRSYWIPIPHLLIIQGEGTHFSNQDTLVSFDPPSSVHLSWQVVLEDTTIWCFVVVMPAWYAGEKDQTVTATATTGREVLKKSFAISGLPFILDDDR